MAEFTPSTQSGGGEPRNSAATLLPTDEDALTRNFSRDLKQSRDHFSTWRKRAEEYYKSYAGDPWRLADKRHMEETDRIPTNVNVALSTINAVQGADMVERREARFQGVDTDLWDATIGDWITRLVRTMFQKCQGHRIDGQVLLDGLITGLGFSRGFVDNERWPFRPSTEHLNPWQVFADPYAKKDNLLDARYIIYQAYWTKDQVAARWDDEVARSLHHTTIASAINHPRNVVADDYSGGHPGDAVERADHIQIYEYCYTRYERWVAFTDETGEDRTIPRRAFEAQGEQFEGVEAVGYPKRTYRRAFIASTKEGGENYRVLEDKRLEEDCFPISAYTGLREVDVHSNKVQFFGLMHVIADMQMLVAKLVSTYLEYLARGAKGGIIAEEGVFTDPEKAQTGLSIPGQIVMVAQGALVSGRIKEREPQRGFPAMQDFLDKVMTLIPYVSAVTDWVKGTAQTERSNVLISNLQSQSMTVLAPILDPMNGYRIQQGLFFAKLCIGYLSERAINRILGNPVIAGITHEPDPANPGKAMVGQDGQPVPLMTEVKTDDGMVQQVPLTAGRILKQSVNLWDFDIEVDTGLASPTARQAFWQLISQHGLLNEIMKLGVPVQDILPDFIEISPLPPEMAKPLADKLRSALETSPLQKVAQELPNLSPEEKQQLIQVLGQEMAQPAQQRRPA